MKKKKLKKKYDDAVWRVQHLLKELEEATKHMKSQDQEIESLMSGIAMRDQLINQLKFEIYHKIPGSVNRLKLDDATLTPECRETRKG